jgi:hypothetical protein
MDFAGNVCAMSQAVAVELVGEAGHPSCLEAELQYNPDDPYAATVMFNLAHKQVRWTFSRDLVVDGLDEPTGDGDVRVRPSLDRDARACVLVELTSPQGRALVQIPGKELRKFVQRMTMLVPSGEESQHIDIDAAVAALLTQQPGE